MKKNFDYDITIIGSGPAGSTTARYIHPNKNNLSVLIIDKRKKIGVPVQCGEGIIGFFGGEEVGSSTYDKKGLFECPKEVKAHRIDELNFVSPVGNIIKIPVKGYTIHRDLFDQYLAERAYEEGAILKTGTSFLGLKDRHTLITSNGEITSNIIVGADGANSSVAKSIGLNTPKKFAKCVIAKVLGDFNDHKMKIFYGKKFYGGYSWIFSKGNHANIGFGIESNYRSCKLGKSIRKTLDDFINLELEGKKFEIIYKGGGIVPTSGPISRTVKENFLIVGDAAGMVCPSTGGGIDSAMIAGRECGTTIWKYFRYDEDLDIFDKNWRNILEGYYRKGLVVKKVFQWMTITDMTTEILFKIINKIGSRLFI